MDRKNQQNKKSETAIVDAVVDLGGSVGGALAGAAIGTAVAGPVGTALGAVTGTAIEGAFRTLGKEIKERVFSKKEDQRIGAVFSLAAQKIRDNISSGKSLREDAFFSYNDGTSPADEILEATIIAAQREYEEKKLPYMANLYANIAFDQSISKETISSTSPVSGSTI